MAIRVNILVERFTIDAQPRWKNGQPAQRTAGVARTSSTQESHPPGKACWTGIPGTMSAIAAANSGVVRVSATQKRRLMSASSGFSSARAETMRGFNPGDTVVGISSVMSPDGSFGGWSKYFAGVALNLSAQPWQQKWKVFPSCTTECKAVPGFTVIPQTGSTTPDEAL